MKRNSKFRKPFNGSPSEDWAALHSGHDLLSIWQKEAKTFWCLFKSCPPHPQTLCGKWRKVHKGHDDDKEWKTCLRFQVLPQQSCPSCSCCCKTLQRFHLRDGHVHPSQRLLNPRIIFLGTSVCIMCLHHPDVSDQFDLFFPSDSLIKFCFLCWLSDAQPPNLFLLLSAPTDASILAAAQHVYVQILFCLHVLA